MKAARHSLVALLIVAAAAGACAHAPLRSARDVLLDRVESAELLDERLQAHRRERLDEPAPVEQARHVASADASAPLLQPEELLPVPAATTLTLDDVLLSVERSYPLLQAAWQEQRIAEGNELAARGAFDLSLSTHTINAPAGFYRNYRHGIGLEQPLLTGGYTYGQYRIGRGHFQPWFGERDTNDGGEFKAGVGLPLLQDRRIDPRRAELSQTGLARRAVEPRVRAELLRFVRAASHAYWSWVAARAAHDAQRDLLELAIQRVEIIEVRIRVGDLEEIARIDNERLIAARETRVIEAQRQLEAAAIQLSLFLRTPDGQPHVPQAATAPTAFPPHRQPDAARVEADIAAALESRPELAELVLAAEIASVELASAQNTLLPKLDAKMEASQDVGARTSPLGDKSPFELEAGLFGDVPLQRRQARGKVQSAQGKLAQLRARQTFLTDVIAAEVQDAASALAAAAARIERADANLQLARRSLDLGGEAFRAGDIDIVILNIYEEAVNDARLLLIRSQADYFTAEADYLAALGLNRPAAPD